MLNVGASGRLSPWWWSAAPRQWASCIRSLSIGRWVLEAPGRYFLNIFSHDPPWIFLHWLFYFFFRPWSDFGRFWEAGGSSQVHISYYPAVRPPTTTNFPETCFKLEKPCIALSHARPPLPQPCQTTAAALPARTADGRHKQPADGWAKHPADGWANKVFWLPSVSNEGTSLMPRRGASSISATTLQDLWRIPLNEH